MTTLILPALLAVFSSRAWSQTQNDRADLVSTYKNYYTGQRPIYQAAPVTHVVPEFNTVTYVLDGKSINTVVTPDPVGKSTDMSAEMAVKGYRVSPYLALSLKRVGLGFNVESGQTSIAFSQKYSGGSQSQNSSVSYRGLGIYGFFKAIDTKIYDLTFIGGGRSTNVKHVIEPMRSSVPSSGYQAPDQTYRYTLNSYEAGINNELRLLKSVTVTPWANYSRTDDANASAQIKFGDANTEIMSEDLDVFWRSRKTIDYGVDLGLRIAGLEIRIGGMLGLIFTSGGSSELVKDTGYGFSLSLNHKG